MYNNDGDRLVYVKRTVSMKTEQSKLRRKDDNSSTNSRSSISYSQRPGLKPHLRRVISILENVLCLPCRVCSYFKSLS